MSAFDKVIGYDAIKEELMQVCDMIHNPEIYERLGAKLPKGILLDGEPGLGKTLMAKCFIEESGLKAFTVRRNSANSDFVETITNTFNMAKEAGTPSVIFLDDMDKFANEDDRHRDAEEYVAVQSGIDEVKGSNVFVIATVNDSDKLPGSLTRPGRFDRIINVCSPNEQDAELIIRHYLSDKKLADDVNMEDLCKMMSYSSCAELETLLNEAAIKAAFARRDSVEMSDIVKSVLRMQYDAPDNYSVISKEDKIHIALHEAGHLVVSEVLCPGSVGLASVRTNGRSTAGGFIHRCKDFPKTEYYAIISLAGKAAVEMCYAGECAKGCSEDIENASRIILEIISEEGTHGFGFIDVCAGIHSKSSENLKSRIETVTQAELERYMMKVRDILINNREFLEMASAALTEKETLLYSDIRRIRESVKIVYPVSNVI